MSVQLKRYNKEENQNIANYHYELSTVSISKDDLGPVQGSTKGGRGGQVSFAQVSSDRVQYSWIKAILCPRYGQSTFWRILPAGYFFIAGAMIAIIFGIGIVERGVPLSGYGNLISIRLSRSPSLKVNPDPFSSPANIEGGDSHILLVISSTNTVRVGDVVVFQCSKPRLIELDDEVVPVWHLDEIDSVRIPRGGK